MQELEEKVEVSTTRAEKAEKEVSNSYFLYPQQWWSFFEHHCLLSHIQKLDNIQVLS